MAIRDDQFGLGLEDIEILKKSWTTFAHLYAPAELLIEEGAPDLHSERLLADRLQSFVEKKIQAEMPATSSEWVMSRTHSEGVALVVAAAKVHGLLGVGVDLERADRDVREGVPERVLTSEESGLGLSFITLWALKEAAFKADPNNAGHTVTQYQVKRFIDRDKNWVEIEKQGATELSLIARWVRTPGGWGAAFCLATYRH